MEIQTIMFKFFLWLQSILIIVLGWRPLHPLITLSSLPARFV